MTVPPGGHVFRKSFSIILFFCLFWSTAQAPAQCTRCGSLLRVTLSTLDFGSDLVGKRSTALRVSLRSLGIFPVNINRIGILGTGFTQTNNCPKTLPNGTSCIVSVVFAPQAIQKYTGQLTITYNGQAKAVVTLTGQGIR
jgi:hypothetical protein